VYAREKATPGLLEPAGDELLHLTPKQNGVDPRAADRVKRAKRGSQAVHYRVELKGPEEALTAYCKELFRRTRQSGAGGGLPPIARVLQFNGLESGERTQVNDLVAQRAEPRTKRRSRRSKR